PRPRKVRLRVPSEPPAEDGLERRELLLAPALVEVEDPLPRGTGLVVVVTERERDLEPCEIGPRGVSCLDHPGEDAHADAVGGAAAGDAVDASAGADRVAVARLEIAPSDLPVRSHGVGANLQWLPAMAVVIASNLRKELAGSVLFDGVSFSVER